MTSPRPPRGTRFPELPKLPDPSAPLRAFINSLANLKQQTQDTVEAAEQLGASASEGLDFLRKKAGDAMKKPLLPKRPRL